MNKNILAIAALVATVGSVATAAHADRKFRTPQGILVQESLTGVGHVISVDPVVTNTLEGTVLNLSGVVTIFVNDVPVVSGYYIYNVGVSIASGCVPNFCDGFCPDPSSFCQPFRPGYPCACYVACERVSSPPVVLHDGDVITASVVELAGSEPEDYTDNDVISMVYGNSCTADFDHNGVREVPDIFAYLTAWFAQSASADLDGVTGIAVPDIFFFLTAWFAGCP